MSMMKCLNKIIAIQTITTIDFAKKSDNDEKIAESEKIRNYDKYITSIDFNIFSSALFDERLKQAKLSTSININTVDQSTIKIDKKIEKLQTFELGYFLG